MGDESSLEALHHLGDAGGFNVVLAGIQAGFSKHELSTDAIKLGHEVLSDISVLTIAEDLSYVVPVAQVLNCLL